jgi:BirA family transcriptional regulator, biotin operon repressor / biotin---[acetyl-CoA-carboxylase] ligase
VLTGSALWSGLTVVASTGSTNEDLLAAARAGVPAGAVLVAEEQTRGRGRLDRSWHSVPGAALTFSVLVRPSGVPAASRGWLPLLAGVAVASAVSGQAAANASLKWPNDVLAEDAKLAGILAEQAGDSIVVGFGINVGQTAAELPPSDPGRLEAGADLAGRPPATSLGMLGAKTDREALLVGVLRCLEHWYLRWSGGRRPGDPEASGLRAAYLRQCSTVGRNVRVELPGGRVLAGLASDVDGCGQLVVQTAAGPVPVSAGDVVHVR